MTLSVPTFETVAKADFSTLGISAEMKVGGAEELSIDCTVHSQPIESCPCPKGPGAWLEYRRLWVEERQRVKDAHASLLSSERRARDREEWFKGRIDLLWLALEPYYVLGPAEQPYIFDRLERAIREVRRDAERKRNLLDVVDQGQFQMVMLALAELGLRRPGWQGAIEVLAHACGGENAQAMLYAFQKTSADWIQSIEEIISRVESLSLDNADDRRRLIAKLTAALPWGPGS